MPDLKNLLRNNPNSDANALADVLKALEDIRLVAVGTGCDKCCTRDDRVSEPTIEDRRTVRLKNSVFL